MAGVPRCRLAPGLEISRIVTGLWQVADLEREGGLGLDRDAAVEALAEHHRQGLTSFDMADHYGSAEELIGALRSLEGGPSQIEFFTKWVPKPGRDHATPAAVDEAVQLSLSRLRTPTVPLLQFHTWDYLDGPGTWLEQMRLLRDHGKVEHLGLTNTDTAHVRLALAEGIPVVSNQVCFSLLDRRACGDMSDLCAEKGVRLLAFGVLAGGLLTDRYLGRPEPSEAELAASWSLAKYRRFVECFGSWDLFQELLRALRSVADRHSVDGTPISVANVATRWILEKPAVAAVLVGVRLGHSEHIADNLRVFQFSLEPRDVEEIDGVLSRSRPIHGDCGDEYRRPPFLTASGDLSHHLSAIPLAFIPRELPGHTLECPRLAVDWDEGSGPALRSGSSRAVRRGGRVAVSGTPAMDRCGQLVGDGDVMAQTTFALDVVEALLKALQASLGDVVCSRLYVEKGADVLAIRRAHGQRFREHCPACTVVEVNIGIEGAKVLVEVEAQVF